MLFFNNNLVNNRIFSIKNVPLRQKVKVDVNYIVTGFLIKAVGIKSNAWYYTNESCNLKI